MSYSKRTYNLELNITLAVYESTEDHPYVVLYVEIGKTCRKFGEIMIPTSGIWIAQDDLL